jgi:amino acid transporter
MLELLVNDSCSGISHIEIIIKNVVFPFVQIVVPVVLIIIAGIFLVIALKSKDKVKIKKAKKRVKKAIILAIIIFFFMIIVANIFDLTVFKNNKEIDWRNCWDKPVLYLYPTVEENIKISFAHPEYLETTYPKFNKEWDVLAKPDCSLYDANGKYYYALYWDEIGNKTDFKTGFYVDKDNAISFLEDKLTYIGLNDRERNEFIMYWLPILEKNEKSLVYFELTDEVETYNKINITPKPDSLLRVIMHVKKVSSKINIKEEKLTQFNRDGFVAVEWGGVNYEK